MYQLQQRHTKCPSSGVACIIPPLALQIRARRGGSSCSSHSSRLAAAQNSPHVSTHPHSLPLDFPNHLQCQTSVSCRHKQQRGGSTIAHAGRPGGAGGSTSSGSNSRWQDRLYGSAGSNHQDRDRHGGVGRSGRGRGAAGRSSPGRGGRGRGRGRGDGRLPASQLQQHDQSLFEAASGLQQPSSSSSSRSRSSSSDGGDGGDFVVIKKASAGSVGSYIKSTEELQVQEKELEGSRFWDAALGEFEDDDEDEWEDEGELGGEDEDEDEDEVGVEEVISLLRELAAGLEDGEELQEGEAGEELPSSDQPADSAITAQFAGRPPSSSSSSPVAAAWKQAYLGSQSPPLTLGAVTIKNTPGKGRGLFTTAAVSAGDALLAAAPLALLYSEEGQTPENEELAGHLIAEVAATAAIAAAAATSSSSSSGSSGSNSSSKDSKPGSRGLAPWQQAALLQLRPPGAVEAQQQLPDLRQLLGPPDELVQQIQQPEQQQQLSKPLQQHQQEQQQQQRVAVTQLPGADLLTQLVFANCTGEEFEDEALVLLRGTTSCGHLGVWPAAALINHSCCPNCHVMLIGDRLVVRAAEDMAPNTELSLSYLGPQLFAPAATRQAELRQQWGFDCNCRRCKAEARYNGASSSSSSSAGSLGQLLSEVYSTCQSLAPQLDAAVESEDVSAVRQLQQQLQDLKQDVEAGLRAAKPPANVRRWLQACVYDLYDLVSLASDQLPPQQQPSKGRGRQQQQEAPPVETEALATCARIVSSLIPGSSAHVELATEYMVRTEAKFSGDHQEAADAARMCASAITTRYGPVNKGMMQLLMDTWAGAALL